MNTYFSTFISGLSEPAVAALTQALADVKIRDVYDGLVVYDTAAPPAKIKSLPFFNNSFSLIFRFKSIGDRPLEHAIKHMLNLGNIGEKLRLQDSGHKRTFRIVTSMENQLVSVDARLLQGMENEIKHKLNLELNKRHGDYEFWVMSRSEGVTFFALRISRQSKKDKEREKGELRPQLSYFLCLLSEPEENEIFMDPCCGTGSIPFTRIEMGRKGLVIAADSDADKVAELKAKVKELKIKDKIVVRQIDVRRIDHYQENSVHKIVTDPPWGLYEKMGDPLELYRPMMHEFIRVLKPGGLLVILISNQPALNDFFSAYNEGADLISSYPVLVSGKKAVIYKIQKR